jgi:Fe-only nitrogenase accessory protein AnfO
MNLPGKVIVYRKKQGQWQELREKEFALGQAQGIRELRARIAQTVDFLNDCKICVGRSITGLPYFELEKAGCSVWEFTGQPLDFLDVVLAKEEESAQEEPVAPLNLPVPEDLGNGCFRISIKEVQENGTGVTSKQVLLPLLRQGQFDQLAVICNHIPPWLESEAMIENMKLVIEKNGPGEVWAVISKT